MAVNVDRISPKNGPAIDLTGMTIKPYTTTLLGTVTGSTGTLTTLTAHITLIGGVNHLSLPEISFTGDGTVAQCALLTGDFIPTTDKYFPVVISLSGTKAAGSIKIAATTGLVSFYSTAAGGVWTANASIVYACVLRYSA